MVHIIFPLTAFVFALALGLVVLLKNQRSTVNRNFLVFSLLVAAMFFSDVFIHAADSSATALMWSKVYWVFIALLPAVFVYFTTFFPKQRMSSKWWVNL
ncbi:hypothetical protein KY328_05895, partial [Candidatus Woesearchaeota archaeon]|nr:hypothetical protein [Candidatus Woesearchaeota archaeon]